VTTVAQQARFRVNLWRCAQPGRDTGRAMSQENVESLRAFSEQTQDIRAFVDAAKRGDADMSLLDPDVVYEDANLPDHIGEAYRGHEGFVRAAERWADASETLTVELERIVGSVDKLVSIHRVHSKARHSGIEFDAALAYTWTFQNGKVIHIQSYRDPTEALEAAGLSE
jgi:ketosteroid isomerase-like protein